MTVFSKFFSYFTSVPYNCYEIAHPLTESCAHFSLTAFGSSLKHSLVLYCGLHLLNRIATGKLNPKALLDSLSQATRSSLFLSFNVYFFTLFICQQYRLFGVIQTSTPIVSGLLSSFLAIHLEQKRRRKMLALYMLNIASETLYQALWKQWNLRPLPYFDVILFMVSLMAYAHRAEASPASAKDDVILRTLKFFSGSRQDNPQPSPSSEPGSSTETPKLKETASKWEIWSRIKAYCLNPPSHTTCSTQVCMHHALRTGSRALLIGWLASVLLTIPKMIRGQPANLLSRKAIGLPLCLLGMASISNLSRCLLGKHLPAQTAHSLSILLSAASIGFYRSNAMSLYVFWRAVELYCVSRTNSLTIPGVTEVLYSICCAIVFYAAVFDPESVRFSYVHFLDRLCGRKLSEMNRPPLMMYGFKTNDFFKSGDFLQHLNADRVSSRFMESVLIWSLH